MIITLSKIMIMIINKSKMLSPSVTTFFLCYSFSYLYKHSSHLDSFSLLLTIYFGAREANSKSKT